MPHNEREDQGRSIQVNGDDTLVVAFDDPPVCQSVADQLRRAGGWLESVAGRHCVVVQFDAASSSLDAACEQLQEQLRRVMITVDTSPTLLEIPVCYGGEYGPDLESLGTTLGLSPEEIVGLHTQGEYAVEMLGFTPGFAYVGGLPEALNVPRLARPRLRVAAGSIGIADDRTGLYALPGPGGWSLIGRTPLRLFEAESEQPFLVTAGTRVRFTAIDADAFRSMAKQ